MSFTSRFSSGTSGSISEQIAAKKALVYDVRFPEGDGTVFFVILVEPAKQKAFLRIMESGATINLRDFGVILHSGYGEPTKALKSELREKYGMYNQ